MSYPRKIHPNSYTLKRLIKPFEQLSAPVLSVLPVPSNPTFRWRSEDNSGNWRLEDNSGDWELESGIDGEDVYT